MAHFYYADAAILSQPGLRCDATVLHRAGAMLEGSGNIVWAADRFRGDGVWIRDALPSREEVASFRERSWDAGYRPVACYHVLADGSCSCGKPTSKSHRPGKHPQGDGWEKRARQDPPFAVEAAVNPKGMNTGYLGDGLSPIDGDIDIPETAALIRALAIKHFGPTIVRWRAGSSRFLLLYRAATGEPHKTSISGKLGKIEVLGHGNQFIAHGVHESGARLQWTPESPTEVPLEQLPAITGEQIDAFFDEAAPIIQAERHKGNGAEEERATSSEGQQGDLFEIVRAVEVIPNNEPKDWEFFNRVGMALWAATNGAATGRELFHRWASQHESYDSAACDERWEHYKTSPPTKIGAGTLIYLARQSNPTERDPPPVSGPGTYSGGKRPDEPGDPGATGEGTVPPAGAGVRREAGSPPQAAVTRLLPPEAWHGLLGEIVRAWEPQTEAHPAAILGSLLTMFGNAAGRGPYIHHAGADHRLNLFTLIVGATARARKGTSRLLAQHVMKVADPTWLENCTLSGLGSGEGLIDAVRDDRYLGKKDKEGNEIIEPGVADKRLLIIEGEFTRITSIMGRDSSTLSAILREAWDGHTLQNKTRNNPSKATGAHISALGHITAEELRRKIDRTELVNGFLNRFLIVHVHRTRKLAMGGEAPPELDGLMRKLPPILYKAQHHMGAMRFSLTARDLWVAEYDNLDRERPGLLDYLTTRAAPQTLRLAMGYAVADGSVEIGLAHLKAALAFWGYCEESEAIVFGHATGDPTADAIAEALRQAGQEGLSRTQMSDIFNRNKPATAIAQAITLLEQAGLAGKFEQPGPGGRMTERWRWIAQNS
jgi:hypothetical protein